MRAIDEGFQRTFVALYAEEENLMSKQKYPLGDPFEDDDEDLDEEEWDEEEDEEFEDDDEDFETEFDFPEEEERNAY